MTRWLLLAIAAAQIAAGAEPPPQPIPYSHKTHLALGLVCKDCHTNADPGEAMGFPSTTKCMACHRTIKTDSPAIQKLAEFAAAKKPVPWARIYRLPSYVDFSHRTHIERGAKCEQCHGPVAERDVIRREKDISMGGCMACHTANKASIDCAYCHEPRQ